MPTAITGSVSYTATMQAIDATSRLGRGVADAAGQYAYYPDKVSGRVFRLDIAAGTFSSIYGASWSGFAMTAAELSPDETTLYLGRTATTVGIYTAAVDGSSGSPTLGGSWTATSAACGPGRMWRDPVAGNIFVFDSTGRNLACTTPGVWATPVIYWYTPGALFVGAVGSARYDPDKILWATTTNNSPYVLEHSRRAGRAKVLAGDGTTSAHAAGSAYAAPVGNVTDVDSDADGRIYYGTSAAVYRLEGGTATQIMAANYSGGGGIIYVPASNCLLVCNGTFEVRKVV